jgi:hypothetical protein
MKKLLLLKLILFVTVLASGQDHELTDKTGSPVSVPSKTPTRYNATRDQRIELKRSQVPELLGNTLSSDQYRGWEESPIHYENGKYSVEVNSADTTRVYFFDENGKRITDLEQIYEDIKAEPAGDSIPLNAQDSVYRSMPEYPSERRGEE